MRTVALVPAYNEGGTICEVIQSTQKHVDRIVVCDDGSTDDTLMILDSLDVDIVRHDANRGYGATLVSLFKYCQGVDADLAVTIDADGQHDPRYITALIEPIKAGESDIVIGSRFLEKDRGQAPWIKIQGIKFLNKLIEWGVGVRLTDSQSGYRAYRVCNLMPEKLIESGMGISTEILIKAMKNGLKITEVPVQISHYERIQYLPLLRHGVSVLYSTLKNV